MTSFDPLHPKTGAVIELLAEHGATSTNDLLKLLVKKRGIKHSKANFYKILGKMIDHQILVKSGDVVSLNMVWATHIHTYASMMQKQAEGESISFPTLKEGERRTFHGDSLEKIDPMWTHLILYLFSQEKDPIIFVYQSHPWYILGRPATERRMYESCHARGKEIRILYGNESFLDHYVCQMHKNSPSTAFITNTPPFPKEGYNLWVCGSYIIECFFPALIAQYFASFFETTTSAKEFDLKTFSSIFQIKVPAELLVSRDTKKADQLRKMFIKYCK